jgi:transposase-like protein
MAKKRIQHSEKFKAKVALDAIKGEVTMAELSSRYGIHATQIQRWKQQLIKGVPDIFSKSTNKSKKSDDKERDDLYKHIGQLKVELDWLKKKSGFEY